LKKVADFDSPLFHFKYGFENVCHIHVRLSPSSIILFRPET